MTCHNYLLLLLLLNCFAFVFGAASAQSCAPEADAPPAFRKCRLQYYVHVLVGDKDINNNFLPALNASFSGPFGSSELYALNITKEQKRTSKKLGYARGYAINTAYTEDGVGFVELEVISYNDGYYDGTIQMQGEVLDFNNEIAIVGGTGSFRGARGYAFVDRLLLDGDYSLFRHDLHFIY